MTHAPLPVTGLDPRQLDLAFPFHWVADAQLRVVQMGSVLRRQFPATQAGSPLGDTFRFVRPQLAELDHQSLLRATGGVVLLETVAPVPLRLRGQLLPCATGKQVLFIGSPWLSKLSELESHALTLQDFAMHDSAIDFLFVHQANQGALEDTRLLAQTLKERSQRLDAIFQLSPDGFVAFDQNGRVDYVNPAFAHLTGLSIAELAGTTEGEVDERLRSLCDSAKSVTDTADTSHARSGRPERRGSPRQTLHLFRPRKRIVQRSLRRGEGKAKVLYLRDVTRETEVDRMKSEFLTTAAHELRTPMASVFGFTELLLKRDFDADTRRDLLQTVHRQAGALIGLLNELLDLARIEARAGKDFKIETQPLRPILQDVVAAMVMPGDERRVHLDLPDILPDVALDAGKFRQALVNVLTNAYKYSPHGGEIRLDVVSRPDGRAVGVRVTDQGIGMTPEQAARAFERFYRADESGNIPGTGLGLSLVKEITELLGGHAELHSRPAEGTEVTLWLPLRSARRRSPSQPEESRSAMEQT